AIRRLMELGYRGVNVTHPLKREAALAVDSLDEAASETGSVNTIAFRGGEALGFNTDWKGFLGPLIDVAGASGFDSALILGAGGAGSSAVYALATRGLAGRVYIASRGGASARALAERASGWGLDARSVSLVEAQDLLPRTELVVNATPVGWGDGSSPIPLRGFRESCVAFEMVYKPLYTRLLLEAAASGCNVVDGLWMLVYQASENLRIWLGMEVSPLELRAHAARALRGGRS
ncbi:MAG: shikimate dehydrogenase, partial [Desulfurococcales archaeon]|nr:shikimate dehydrogenase [Desulfurococcales archaeon]